MKSVQLIKEGAVELATKARPVIRAHCESIIQKCTAEDRRSFEKCPEAKKCIDAFTAVQVASTGLLILAREAALALQLGKLDDATKLIAEGLQLLSRARHDYEVIKGAL